MTQEKQKEEEQPKESKSNEELTTLLKRTQADFINFKNRTEREMQHLVQYASSGVVADLLPVLDTFELALANECEDKEFKRGMQMVFGQLLDVLRKKGLKEIDTSGKLDTELHEVMLKEESEEPEDTILQVLQKGYLFKEKVIRHAKVKVAA